MNLVRRHSAFRLRRLILPALAAAYLGYFGFHAFHGTYGLIAAAEFAEEAAALEGELAELRADRGELERHVALLRPANLDPDMLDERARAALNMIGPNEVIILP
ncbi:MAG: septum formation initiator family protein [Bauldia sp.]|nr:septum formation initiator family protein [Bauldia sp.]